MSELSEFGAFSGLSGLSGMLNRREPQSPGLLLSQEELADFTFQYPTPHTNSTHFSASDYIPTGNSTL